MKACEVELAVVQLFGCRQTVIVPNVWWGWGLDHEADLICLSPAGIATEVEIKVSKQDLIADKEKQKWKFTHRYGEYNPRISKIVFAMPSKLEVCIEHVPDFAGIILVSEDLKASWLRKPKKLSHARKISTDEKAALMRLGCMKYWSFRSRREN